MVSNASHELRTPLTALLAVNEVALRKKNITDAKAREVISKNVDEATKLRDLTNSLLALTQIDNQTSTKSTFNSNELLNEITDRYKAAANQKNIEISSRVSAETITANRLALTQVLGVLVDNAIKYSPQNSQVIIDLSSDSVAVTDFGAGISQSDQARIFERFYRADSARTRSESSGYGLGLAIAKTVCERHGYKISVDSNLSKGSTFLVEIS